MIPFEWRQKSWLYLRAARICVPSPGISGRTLRARSPYAWPPRHHQRFAPVGCHRGMRCFVVPVRANDVGGIGWKSNARRKEIVSSDRNGVRLPAAAHFEQPWRIHDIAPDFTVEDVWALPTPGGPDDFPRLLELITRYDPSCGSSALVRALFAIRWKIGAALGWDEPDAGRGSRPPTLRDRLPADLLDGPPAPSSGALPFTSLYLTEVEWAAEIVNRTVHGVVHIGWVPDGSGGHRGQMAVLVKPNGRLGSAYMQAIERVAAVHRLRGMYA